MEQAITEEAVLEKLARLKMCDAQTIAHTFVTDERQMSAAVSQVNSLLYSLRDRQRVHMIRTASSARPRWKCAGNKTASAHLAPRPPAARQADSRGRSRRRGAPSNGVSQNNGNNTRSSNGTEKSIPASRPCVPVIVVVIDLSQCANRIMDILQMPHKPVQVIACVSDRYWSDPNTAKPMDNNWVYIRECLGENNKKTKHNTVVRAIWYISQMVTGRQMDGPWAGVTDVHVYSNNELFGTVADILRENKIRCVHHRAN